MDISDCKRIMTDHFEDVVKELLPNAKKNGARYNVGSVRGEPGESLVVWPSGQFKDFANSEDQGDLIDLWMKVRGSESVVQVIEEVNHTLALGLELPGRSPKKGGFLPASQKLGGGKSASRGGKGQSASTVSPTKPVVGSSAEEEAAHATASKLPETLPLGEGWPAFDAKADEAIRAYLRDQRGIPDAVIDRYGVYGAAEYGPLPHWKSNRPMKGPWIVFPYWGPDGTPRWWKALHLRRKEQDNGKPPKKVIIGGRLDARVDGLFGWPGYLRTVAQGGEYKRKALFAEGEIDAMTWAAVGVPAFSLPDGTGSVSGDSSNARWLQWLTNDHPALAPIEEFFISGDEDEAGHNGWQEELARRLGLNRTRQVRLGAPESSETPYKDPNEAWTKGAGAKALLDWIESARAFQPNTVAMAGDLREDIHSLFLPEDEQPEHLSGIPFPFANKKAGSPMSVRLVPGDYSIITGYSGHGKTSLTSMAVVKFLEAGYPVGMVSPEWQTARLYAQMLVQATGNSTPSRPYRDQVIDWFDDKGLLMSASTEAVSLDHLKEMFYYAYARWGTRIFVVDSLMLCDIPEDDYEKQREFVQGLKQVMAEVNGHLLLVAHPRKETKSQNAANEGKPPLKQDVKGGGGITDAAANVITVHRNDFSELGGGNQNPNQSRAPEREGDSSAIISKNRIDGADIGDIPLYFDDQTKQFSNTEFGFDPVVPFHDPSAPTEPDPIYESAEGQGIEEGEVTYDPLFDGSRVS